ncbi:MAG: hypothetical protein KGZ45_06660 [Clostridium sp.]|nr:hypothetical protein [Clostridium sp.]
MNKINKLKLFYLAKIVVSIKILVTSGSILVSESPEKDYFLVTSQQLLMGLFMFLLGTESLVFNKDKMGYIYYIVGVVSSIVFFYRLGSIPIVFK